MWIESGLLTMAMSYEYFNPDQALCVNALLSLNLFAVWKQGISYRHAIVRTYGKQTTPAGNTLCRVYITH